MLFYNLRKSLLLISGQLSNLQILKHYVLLIVHIFYREIALRINFHKVVFVLRKDIEKSLDLNLLDSVGFHLFVTIVQEILMHFLNLAELFQRKVKSLHLGCEIASVVSETEVHEV